MKVLNGGLERQTALQGHEAIRQPAVSGMSPKNQRSDPDDAGRSVAALGSDAPGTLPVRKAQRIIQIQPPLPMTTDSAKDSDPADRPSATPAGAPVGQQEEPARRQDARSLQFALERQLQIDADLAKAAEGAGKETRS